MPGGGACSVAAPLEVTGASAGRLAVGGLVRVLHAAISDDGGGGADTDERQPAHGLASGQQPVDVVGGDLFGDVALQRSHRSRVCPEILNLRWQTALTAILDVMIDRQRAAAPSRGRVAVVAGATRGAGRGIAAALGEAGATVVCTGRTSSSVDLRSDYDRPETIEETAQLVTELGGVGVAVPTDHLDVAQVRALADRLRRDYGAIDVLVNDIWGAEILKGPPSTWNRPMWEHDLDDGLRILRLGVDTHLITSHCLLPLLIARPGGLLVEVTDGTAEFNAQNYRLSAFYDLAKVAVNRMAFSQGHELAPYGCTAVAVTPGWLRSEMMLDNYGVTEANWRDALRPGRADGGPDRARRPSPNRRRRGSSAAGSRRIAADPDRARWNQRSVSSVRTGPRVRLHRRRRPPARRLGRAVDIFRESVHDFVDTGAPRLFYDGVTLRHDHPQRPLVRRHRARRPRSATSASATATSWRSRPTNSTRPAARR